MTNHPNRNKHQRGAQCIYRDMTARELDRAIDTQAELLAALNTIIENATIAPDGTMSGSTDIYTVPLDDIEAAKTVVAKAEGR